MKIEFEDLLQYILFRGMSYGDGFGYGNGFTGGAGFGGYGSVMEPGASVWLCKFYLISNANYLLIL